MEKALIPNLVWRAGRVEGVARKVALTATHGLLKAGGVSPQVCVCTHSRTRPRTLPHYTHVFTATSDSSTVSYNTDNNSDDLEFMYILSADLQLGAI